MYVVIIRVLWETNFAVEICAQVAHGGKHRNSTCQGRKRDWQREKRKYNKSSANPTGSSQARIIIGKNLVFYYKLITEVMLPISLNYT